MTARLIVDPSTFRIADTGPSTGNIWVRMDNIDFPAEGWNDFIVVVLEAWVAAFLRTLHSSQGSWERVHFMEGPYEVSLSCGTRGVLRLSAGRRGLTGGVPSNACFEVHSREFGINLIEACEAIVLACRTEGDVSRDAKRLEESLPNLQSEVLRMT